MDDRGLIPGAGTDISFLNWSRPALGPIQLSSNGYQELSARGIVKWLQREADFSPSCTAEREYIELDLHSPIHLHDVLLK
jgi:hypothetical protein